MTGTYEITRIVILNKDADEIENTITKEIHTGSLEGFRIGYLHSKYPEIKQRFPDIRIQDLSVLLSHKKLA